MHKKQLHKKTVARSLNRTETHKDLKTHCDAQRPENAQRPKNALRRIKTLKRTSTLKIHFKNILKILQNYVFFMQLQLIN